jgi:hypothetical protein
VSNAFLGLLVMAALAAPQAPRRSQTFAGTITDDTCGTAGHAGMRMGPTDAECVTACIGLHGSAYVLILLDGKTVYGLSDQKAPEKFAGQRVRVVGTLDAKTKAITVRSIAAAR